jgi:peptide/nickel transport system substrate-binding protein
MSAGGSGPGPARPTRRRVLAALGGTVAGVAAAAAVGGCRPSGRPDADPPGTADGPGRSPGTDRNGADRNGADRGVLRVVAAPPTGPLDPVTLRDPTSVALAGQCLEHLCGLERGGRLVPALATSWTTDASAAVWRFTLRPGVTWQRGAPMNATDVVASLERALAAGPLGEGPAVRSVSAPDPGAVVIELDGPDLLLPERLSPHEPRSAITPASWNVGRTLDAAADGTGPWRLERLEEGRATFVRHDGWWGPMPAYGRVEWSFEPNPGLRNTAMRRGSADVLAAFAPETAPELAAMPGFTVVGTPSAAHRQLWMRTDRGVFRDLRVRQALAWSIDRAALVAELLGGQGTPGADHPVAPVHRCSQPGAAPARIRDLARARALMREAGVDGPLRVTLQTPGTAELPALARAIAAQAREAGFVLEVTDSGGEAFSRTQWCPDQPAQPPCSGSAELGLIDFGHRASPVGLLSAVVGTGGRWNASQYGDPSVDAAITAMRDASDLDAMRGACGTVERLVQEAVPAVVPYVLHHLGGHRPSVSGVRWSPAGQVHLEAARPA